MAPGRLAQTTVPLRAKPRESQVVLNSGIKKSKTQARTVKQVEDIRSILLALDCGTAFLKSCFWVSKKHDTRYGPNSVEEVGTVIWSNRSTIVRAHAAFDGDDKLLFATDVDSAIAAGDIKSSDTIAYLKPMLYGDEMQMDREADVSWVCDPETELVGALGKLKVTPHLAACGETVPLLHERDSRKTVRLSNGQLNYAAHPSTREIPHLEICSQLMGWFYKSALTHVSIRNPDLNWDKFKEFTERENFPPAGHSLKIAVLTPSKASVRSRVRLVAALRAANIPNFVLVREAAAALAHYIMTSCESGNTEDFIGKTYLIVDCGSGSVDIEVWTIKSVRPLKVRVELPTETLWKGARTANRHAREMVLDRITDSTLESISRARGASVNLEGIGREVEDEFEIKKQKPNTTEARRLEISGLPIDEINGLDGDRGVLLDEDDMESIQDLTVEPMVSATLDYMSFLYGQKKTRKDTSRLLDGIIGVGGGFINPYAQQKVREGIQNHSSLVSPRYMIPVHFPEPSGISASLNQVAGGGILLVADGEPVGDRVVERSFFTLYHFEGDLRVFLFIAKGQKLDEKAGETRYYNQTLPRDENQGLTYSEEVYYSDEVIDDNAKFSREDASKLDMLVISHPLTKEELAHMLAVSSLENPSSISLDHYQIQSSLDMTFDGTYACLTTTIPRTGRFGHAFDPGADPIVKKKYIDFRGILRPVGAIVEEEDTAETGV